MTKKHFIALADAIKNHNYWNGEQQFTFAHLATLADFCYAQNSQFKPQLWLDYIAGEVGPNGSTPKGK